MNANSDSVLLGLGSSALFKIRNELAKNIFCLVKRCEFLNEEEKEDYYDSANKSHSDS